MSKEVGLNSSFRGYAYWRSVRDQSAAEKSSLEAGWESTHSIAFSRINDTVNPLLRDYFDRAREVKEPTYELKRGGKYHPWWRLDFGPDYQIREGGWNKSAMGRSEARPDSASSHQRPWDGRHALTVSRSNDVYCPAQREFFGRFVEPEAKRVYREKPIGITKHYLPHRNTGNPDGCDRTRRLSTRTLLTEFAFAASAVKRLLPYEQNKGAEQKLAKHRTLPERSVDFAQRHSREGHSVGNPGGEAVLCEAQGR